MISVTLETILCSILNVVLVFRVPCVGIAL